MTGPVLETKVKDESLIIAIVENKRIVAWFRQYFFGDCLIFCVCVWYFVSLTEFWCFVTCNFFCILFFLNLSTTAISFLVAYGYFPLSILNVLFHPYFVILLSGSCGETITHFQVGVECFVTKTEHAKK